MDSRPVITPWLSLPAEVGPLITPHLPELARQVIETLPLDVPEYARPFRGTFGAGVHRGVEVAMQRFSELPGTDRPALSPASRQVYEGLGRGEVREGRSLNALMAAYRSGARTTFRMISTIAADAGLPTAVIVSLGESILAYLEELSAASAEGYAAEQSERAGERDRLRAVVADMVVRGHGDEESVRAAAATAGWVLPDRLVAVTVPLGRAEGLRGRLGPAAVVVRRESDAVALVPAPTMAAARRELESALEDRGAAVGPVRGWRDAPDSLRLAGLAQAALRGSGDEVPLWVDERLGDLVLAVEPRLVADLAERRLAPLTAVPAGRRERLTETLLSWLRHRGERGPIAAELNVHRQTVGYRVNQLRELFGEDLEDPEVRFELELALRARVVAHAAHQP
jgi:hypothetical protein